MNTPRIVGLLVIPILLWLTFYFWSQSKERELSHQEIFFLASAALGFFTTIYFVFLWQEL